MADIVIRHRFTFPPIFRKALAAHYGHKTVDRSDIAQWLDTLAEREAQHIINQYHDNQNPHQFRQTACRYCGQDIEGYLDENEWRDRGNNRHCPNDSGQIHAPVKE